MERDLKFNELDLSEALQEAIRKQGYETPTEIQQKAIPLLLESNNDFIGQAQTGTGKTAAFVLPLLNRINFNKVGLQALILAPTRELAGQVESELTKLSEFSKVTSVAIFGGASYDRQIQELRRKKPQIIVGTPGRVIDLMDRGILKFENADFLILDEADEMLKMGFLDDVQLILKSFPSNRKTWMFSATMPAPIVNMVQNDFRDPVVVSIKKKTLSNADIEQRYYVVDQRQRREALYRLLQVEKDLYGIVFCRTRVETKELTSYLVERGLKVEGLSGEMSQSQREYTMSRFRLRKVNLLICTDVAARGIDINDLTHVFNYGLPQDMDSYVHRIGRTGRAGSKGIAATLVDPRDMGFLRKIEKLTKSQMIASQLPSVTEMKKELITSKLSKMEGIKKTLEDKGEEFKLDNSFEAFSSFFEGLDSEQLKKLFFTYMFNRDLIRLDEIGDLRVRSRVSKSPRANTRSPRGRSRDGGAQRSSRDPKKTFSGRRHRGEGRSKDGRRTSEKGSRYSNY